MPIARRLINFLGFLAVEGVAKEDMSSLARSELFAPGEEDTAVYVYGPFDVVSERHSESDLVIHIETTSVVKLRGIWQGANIVVEGNFPVMGWGKEDGEFGLGGDWWKGK